MSVIDKCVYKLERLDILSLNSEKAISSLENTLHRQGCIHITNQDLDPHEYINFAKKLGILEIVRPEAHRLKGYEYIRLQSNIPGVGVQGGGGYWHSDSPWYDPPSLYTLLYCIEAPKLGGETFFVNMCELLRNLNPSLQELLDKLNGVYPCKSILEAEFSQMQIHDVLLLQQMKDIVRGLIQVHPVTQEKFLFINEKWLSKILNVAAEESEKLLKYIYAEVENYCNKYIHKWAKGDLLIWDNNVVVHKASKCSPYNRKITQRIIVKSKE